MAGCEGNIVGKHSEKTLPMVVKLLSKAISDYIKGVDGFVMTLSHVLSRLDQMKDSESHTRPLL